jgi:pantothenate kinase
MPLLPPEREDAGMPAAVIDIAGLAADLTLRARTGRVIAAIAGPPGAGKSTVADQLCDLLNQQSQGMAAILPMDGYHLDNMVITPLGLRPRKGIPETFDPDGLYHMLVRLRANQEPQVAVPVFDRDVDISRAGARFIASTVAVVIVEGLYLLLKQDPWPRMRPLFDLAVMVDVPEEVLRERLTARWVGYGLSQEEIDWKVDGNDLPNGRFVKTQSDRPDYLLKNY